MSITYVTPDELTALAALDDRQHEVLAYSITADNQEAEIDRLKGEAQVMARLLAAALEVLQTIEPESAPEDEQLALLRGKMWSVLLTVQQRPGK